MSDLIHPTAIIEDGATLGKDVTIGPYSVVGSNVVLGDGVVLHSHVVVTGNTTIGAGTKVFPFASLGHAPQDLKYGGEASFLEIGANNVIREHVTMNPGTAAAGDAMLTKIGNNCLFMVGSHVAHDCNIGNNVIMANNATLAGHVEVGDYAVIGGLAAIHQFVRIGHRAMIGGMSGIESDVIPYGQASGERAGLVGLNLIGLKRSTIDRKDVNSLRSAYRLLFSPEGTLAERLQDVEDRFSDSDYVKEIIGFMRDNGLRSLCQPKNMEGKNASSNGNGN